MQLINALHNTIIEHLSWKCSGQSITQSNWEEGLNVSLSLYLKIASREWKLYKECNCSLPSLLVLLILLLLLSHFSPVWLCDQIHCSPSGSAVPGILQTRTLEWIAISFSNAWKWKVKVKSLSRVWLFSTPWTAAYQAPPSMVFSRQEYWSGVPLPSPLILLAVLKWSPSWFALIEYVHHYLELSTNSCESGFGEV